MSIKLDIGHLKGFVGEKDFERILPEVHQLNISLS